MVEFTEAKGEMLEYGMCVYLVSSGHLETKNQTAGIFLLDACGRFASGFAPPRSTPPQMAMWQYQGRSACESTRIWVGKAHFVHTLITRTCRAIYEIS